MVWKPMKCILRPNALCRNKAYHEVYHDTLEDQDAIEESDKFFFEVQDTYIAALKSATDWIRSVGDPDQKVKPAGDGEISRQEMMSLMNLPKIEIKPFNGDP